jgi:hypothetical protein
MYFSGPTSPASNATYTFCSYANYGALAESGTFNDGAIAWALTSNGNFVGMYLKNSVKVTHHTDSSNGVSGTTSFFWEAAGTGTNVGAPAASLVGSFYPDGTIVATPSAPYNSGHVGALIEAYSLPQPTAKTGDGGFYPDGGYYPVTDAGYPFCSTGYCPIDGGAPSVCTQCDGGT